LAGANIVGFDYSSQYSTRGNLLNNDNPQYNFAVGTETSGGTADWDAQVGFFGRINYAFKDKYLLEATLRRDGSSKFPTHLKWQTYPGVSGGWVLSNESFMEGVKPVLSFAKLRASWGNIGDQSVPNYLYVPRMPVSKNSWLGGGGLPNFQLGTPDPVSQDVSWQNIEHMNLGIDMRFFDNKLGITAEVFQRYTRDMIVAGDALPATYGNVDANNNVLPPQSNLGDVRTRGWEINLDFNHQFDSGLRLSIDANLADAVSFITKGADYKDAPENRRLATP
jgi:hypothetical protein